MACFEVRTWHAIHFLRSCRGPALAELGHPDVAAGRYSGIALACATRNPFIASPQVGAQTPIRNHHRTQIPICISRRAVCGTSPQYSPPRLRAHSSQAEGPRFSPLRATRTLPRTTERGMEGAGRGWSVPSRHQGVRSGARTGSLQEQGTYRLDQPYPKQPKTKTPYRTGKGVESG